ncbi:class I glutamine amidotransferase-like protein [Panus rudis PR-1116 ss-1]|nr:class I glutamine amidotransferase-like protein [Panus rudis PR-1116 ss-1]
MAESSPIRIALFLCDTPIPAVQETDGDYTQIFKALLQNSSPKTEFILDPYDVRNKQEYPDNVEQYSAIILTGSAASAYENLDWINLLVGYIASVAKEKPQIKLLGICFGHQIIARSLGCECVPNGGKWEVGVTPVDLTETGKQVFGIDKLNIQQMHRDHVPDIPKGCHLLGSTEVSHNQGFIRFVPGSRSAQSAQPDFSDPETWKDIQIFTVQGHPEFTRRIVDKIVDARSATGVIGKDVAEDARRRAEWRNDGVDVIGKVLWRIIGVNPS